MADIKRKIEEANDKVLKIIKAGQPKWIGCKDAIEVIPGMTENTFLHAGPPINWENMPQPTKNAIIGAVVYEGLASSRDEALEKIEADQFVLRPCHELMATGGMTGITSARTPVHVVHNETYGCTAYCGFHEGGGPNGFGWGTNDDESIAHLRWMRDELALVLDAALEKHGGINMRQIISRSVQMGDECHGRCAATTALIIRELVPFAFKLDIDKDILSRSFDFLGATEIFSLHIIMAAGRSMVEPAKNIPYSTIVTTMARNGVEYGIKISSLGDTWFTGPSQPIHTTYFSPEWKDEDALPDIGDSSIVETIGLGGLIHVAAPAHDFSLGGTYSDSLAKTNEAYAFCAGEHDAWTLPNLDFRGLPLGIDIRKVISTGKTPILDTATVHLDGGKIGAGEARAPMLAFEKALIAYNEYVDNMEQS